VIDATRWMRQHVIAAGSIGLSGWLRNAATGVGTLDVSFRAHTLREFSGGPSGLPIEGEAPSSERLTAVFALSNCRSMQSLPCYACEELAITPNCSSRV
jgi:hypothetical protein